MNALVALVIAGEFDMSMPSAEYRVTQMVAKGAPVKFHCPEPVPTTVQSVAAMAKTPSPNAAKLYINWMLSREGQLSQYQATQAAPVHPAFQRREFMSFPDQIIGKTTAFRTPDLMVEQWPSLPPKLWNRPRPSIHSGLRPLVRYSCAPDVGHGSTCVPVRCPVGSETALRQCGGTGPQR